MDNNSMMTSLGDFAVETERQALDVINPGLMVFIVVVTVLMSLVGIPGNILIVAATYFEKASLIIFFIWVNTCTFKVYHSFRTCVEAAAVCSSSTWLWLISLLQRSAMRSPSSVNQTQYVLTF